MRRSRCIRWALTSNSWSSTLVAATLLIRIQMGIRTLNLVLTFLTWNPLKVCLISWWSESRGQLLKVSNLSTSFKMAMTMQNKTITGNWQLYFKSLESVKIKFSSNINCQRTCSNLLTSWWKSKRPDLRGQDPKLDRKKDQTKQPLDLY